MGVSRGEEKNEGVEGDDRDRKGADVGDGAVIGAEMQDAKPQG